MVEDHGDLREGSKSLNTDEINDILRLNLVVIGSVLEVQRKHSLLLEICLQERAVSFPISQKIPRRHVTYLVNTGERSGNAKYEEGVRRRHQSGTEGGRLT